MRAAPWPAFIAVLAGAAGVLAMLLGDKQWQVAATAAIAVALLIAGGRLGWGERVHASATAHPKLAPAFAWLVAIATLFVLREHNFELLMLCTVMLYMVAGLGLTVQFGYTGVVNFAARGIHGGRRLHRGGARCCTRVVPHVLVMPIAGGLVSAVIGSVLLLPLLRTRGHYAALITIAFGILFRTFLEVNDTLGGPQGLKVPAGWNGSVTVFNDAIEIERRDRVVLLSALRRPVRWSCCFCARPAVRAAARAFVAGSFALDRRAARRDGGLCLRPQRRPPGRSRRSPSATSSPGLAGAVYAMVTGVHRARELHLRGFADPRVHRDPWRSGQSARLACPPRLIVVVLPEKLQVIQEYRFLLFAAPGHRDPAAAPRQGLHPPARPRLLPRDGRAMSAPISSSRPRLSVRFGGVRALDGLDISVSKVGEVLGRDRPQRLGQDHLLQRR